MLVTKTIKNYKRQTNKDQIHFLYLKSRSNTSCDKSSKNNTTSNLLIIKTMDRKLKSLTQKGRNMSEPAFNETKYSKDSLKG